MEITSTTEGWYVNMIFDIRSSLTFFLRPWIIGTCTRYEILSTTWHSLTKRLHSNLLTEHMFPRNVTMMRTSLFFTPAVRLFSRDIFSFSVEATVFSCFHQASDNLLQSSSWRNKSRRVQAVPPSNHKAYSFDCIHHSSGIKCLWCVVKNS